jgi:hypothetical protein
MKKWSRRFSKLKASNFTEAHMTRFVLAFLVAHSVLLAGDPVPTPPAAIQFPKSVSVAPVAPAVGSVPVLTPGQFYVVTSDVEFFLLASPAEKVVVTYEQGPLKLRGVFADGSGRIETRTYQAAWLAIVDAAEGVSGRVELVAVPKGVATEVDITRQLIDIGVAPQPPPKPDSSVAGRVTKALAGGRTQEDAVALVVASEKILEGLATYRDGAELLTQWGALLKANGWVRGSRPEIAAMIGSEIPAGEAVAFTAADKARIKALFDGVLTGSKAVLK